MKQFYSKLNNNFLNNDYDWTRFKGSSLYSQYNSEEILLQYFSIDNHTEFKRQHTRKFFSIIPDRVSFSVITGKGKLLPHKDHGFQVSLNYYINACKDTTQFYDISHPNVVGISYPGRSQSNIFDENELTKTDRFIAASNDVFLLNVSEIHSVIKISSEPRVFISYSWKSVSYDEILVDIQKHLNE